LKYNREHRWLVTKVDAHPQSDCGANTEWPRHRKKSSSPNWYSIWRHRSGNAEALRQFVAQLPKRGAVSQRLEAFGNHLAFEGGRQIEDAWQHGQRPSAHAPVVLKLG